MTPELQNKLYEEYPKLFENRHKSMQESCMYWGVAVGEGWYNIIDVLCNCIVEAFRSNQITTKDILKEIE